MVPMRTKESGGALSRAVQGGGEVAAGGAVGGAWHGEESSSAKAKER